MYCSYYESPIGVLEIKANEINILSVKLTDCTKNVDNSNKIIENCKKQLKEYFCGERKIFDLSIEFVGTEFQKKVWEEVFKIPCGKTISYKEVAKNVGKEKAVRAVGTAIGKNPIAIVVPCHRVISANGKIGGYAYGAYKKQELLNLERNFSE